MKHVGKVLAAEIKKRGIVQARLAEKLGVPRTSITYMLQRKTMDITRYEEMCNLIGCHPMVAFDDSRLPGVQIGDITQTSNSGENNVQVNDGMLKMLVDLLDAKDKSLADKEDIIKEKEKVIQLLAKMIDPEKLAGLSL